MTHPSLFLLLLPAMLYGVTLSAHAATPFEIDHLTRFQVELTKASRPGVSSIREHSVAWHPVQQKYYLIADVVPLSSVHHPNTYDTELHLWSSIDLTEWTHHGVAVEKGPLKKSYDRYGVASPAGMIFTVGRLLVPFSARRTSEFRERSIGIAISPDDPEVLPWTKTNTPVSDLAGEDDDPALLKLPAGDAVHLYHRNAGPDGYQIVHTSSTTPRNPKSWPKALIVTQMPSDVRAQELTGAFSAKGKIHLLIIEHMIAGGARIAHLTSNSPTGPFKPAVTGLRYLSAEAQPTRLAYSGHISPLIRDDTLVAFFWTVPQENGRYGLQGHPVR